MDGVIHRWEWRVFGRELMPGAEILSGLTSVGEPQETDEIYLLSPDEGVNVKIRFDLLDVKKLLEVDADGLELWDPVWKQDFPMTADDALSVFDIWGLARPEATRDSYTLQQFLDEMVAPDPGLTVVDVHKRRVRYSIDGCMSELTSMSANGRATSTIAAETEDASAVLAAVAHLGLTGHVNTNYNRGLRCLVGLAPVRYGVVDIGTNSVKFHIGEQHPDGSWVRVVDRAEVTRLGEGLDEHGELQPEPVERTAQAVDGMVEEARANDVLAIAAVGTAALRIAPNAPSVVATISERAGVPVEVVSGEEESRLAYLAVSAGVGLADRPLVVFDTGGGSTQFTFGQGKEVEERFSVNVGAVANTERFGLDGVVSDETLAEARRALAGDLDAIDDRPAPDALVGMGGAMTNITAVSLSMSQYDPDAVQGATITADEVERQIAMYASMGSEERRSIVGLQPNRATVILAGALIVSTVMSKLGQESVLVSDRGLRHGLIRERFGL